MQRESHGSGEVLESSGLTSETDLSRRSAWRFEVEDADLAAVIEAWPNLPEAVRAGIVAMVGAAAE